jgi:1-acyl-sn-glycerol-3-phosphate acyltransferase
MSARLHSPNRFDANSAAAEAAAGRSEMCEVVSLAERRREREPLSQPQPRGLVGEVATLFGGVGSFLRRRITGDYRVDDFGYDQHLTESVLLPILRPMYDRWFRVEVSGIENIPDNGSALIVANHAGVVAWDGLMIQLAVHDHHRRKRPVRLLGADLVFQTPVLDAAARAMGAAPACPDNADKLLDSGELVAVFPEGFKGCGKPFANRYQLQRFGRGGFAATAIRAGAPIVPCSVVGAEETYPKIADIAPLAKALGLPYFPLTPLFPHFGPLGLVPLPTKWRIEFGRPIPTDAYPRESAADEAIKSVLADRVRDTIQQTLDTMLTRRRNVFLG